MVTEPKDLRSTGRKRGRAAKVAVLIRDGLPYVCEKCGKGPSKLPLTVDPLCLVGGEEGEEFPLEVNHINKDLNDCEEANLQLLCKADHRALDSLSLKGVSLVEDEYGYGLSMLRELEED